MITLETDKQDITDDYSKNSQTVTVGKPKQQLTENYPRNSKTGCNYVTDDYSRDS